jgi:hypothetical protein
MKQQSAKGNATFPMEDAKIPAASDNEMWLKEFVASRMSRDYSIIIVTRIRAGSSRIMGSILGRDSLFSSIRPPLEPNHGV